MKTYAMLAHWVGSLVGVTVCLFLGNAPAAFLFATAFVLNAYLIFRDTLNTVQYAGRVYWIVRDTVPARTPRICRGFMRQVTYPWLVGSGIQVRVMGRTVQVGVCYRQHATDDTQGVLHALEGRIMEENPEQIGTWK